MLSWQCSPKAWCLKEPEGNTRFLQRLVKWFIQKPPAEYVGSLGSPPSSEFLGKDHSFRSNFFNCRWEKNLVKAQSPSIFLFLCEFPPLQIVNRWFVHHQCSCRSIWRISWQTAKNTQEVTDSKGDEQNPLRVVEQWNISLQGKYLPFALGSYPWVKKKYSQTQHCLKWLFPEVQHPSHGWPLQLLSFILVGLEYGFKIMKMG